MSKSTNQSRYLQSLRENARALWSGVWTDAEFMEGMFLSIDYWLSHSWTLGAEAVGIAPDEITPKEQMQLSAIIFKEYSFVPRLATRITAMNKEHGGKLAAVFALLAGWVVRYNDVYNRAKVAAESDPKLRWSLGPTTMHCGTCAKLNGKVKRASWWRDNVMPQMPPNGSLECKGWRCLCDLSPTSDPLTKGRMPNVP
jgi:hypothetical protein